MQSDDLELAPDYEYDDYDENDLVPLGQVLEDLDARRERDAWAADCARAHADLDKAMGRVQADAKPIDFVSARTLLAADYGDTPWLIGGLVTRGAVAVIGGEPKTAKTWSAIEMAMAVASGSPAFGTFNCSSPEPLGAVCFLVEDGAKSLQNRVRSLALGRGMHDDAWCDRLFIKSLGSMNLADLSEVARYVATVRRLPITPGIVVFDPLRDLHTVNEDSSTEMQPIYSALRALRTVLDCTVLFVHHSAKSTDGNAARRGGQKLRGSSALHGAVDVGLYMSNSRISEEGQKTVMAAHVESEVKAAKSAGHFDLSLEIYDNSNGEAIRAQWVYSKPTAAEVKAIEDTKASDAAEKADRIVWGIFAAEAKAVPGGHPPLTTAAVVGRCHLRKALVVEALQRLVAVGRLTVTTGPRQGQHYQATEAPPPTAVMPLRPPPSDPDAAAEAADRHDQMPF